MTRTSKYIDAALVIFAEAEEGDVIQNAVLVQTIIDKGLLQDRQYLYNNIFSQLRKSKLFNTSQRGVTSLTVGTDAAAAQVIDKSPTEAEHEGAAEYSG